MTDKTDNIEDTNDELKGHQDETFLDGTLDDTLEHINEDTTSETEEEVSDLEDDKSPEEVKAKAKSTGHLTLEEFIAKGGKKEDYKTEKEFVLTGELIDLKKTVQKRDKDIEEILKYQKKVIEDQKANLRQKLALQLAEAKANMDVDEVERLSLAKNKADAEEQSDHLTAVAEDIRKTDEEFIANNSSWFNDAHPELKQRAVEIGNRLKLQYPSITYKQMSVEIEQQMKFELSRSDAYSHLLTDTSTIRRPQVSPAKSAVAQSGATSGENSDDKLYAKLSANEKVMFNIHKRIAAKVGEKVSVKEFINHMNEDREV